MAISGTIRTTSRGNRGYSSRALNEASNDATGDKKKMWWAIGTTAMCWQLRHQTPHQEDLAFLVCCLCPFALATAVKLCPRLWKAGYLLRACSPSLSFPAPEWDASTGRTRFCHEQFAAREPPQVVKFLPIQTSSCKATPAKHKVWTLWQQPEKMCVLCMCVVLPTRRQLTPTDVS